MNGEEFNVLVCKEDKNTVKSIWQKSVDKVFDFGKKALKFAPIILSVFSLFAPSSAPILNSVSAFLNSDTGKKVTEITGEGLDVASEVLQGNIEEAKEEIQECLNLYTVDEAGQIINDTANFIDEIKGMKR